MKQILPFLFFLYCLNFVSAQEKSIYNAIKERQNTDTVSEPNRPISDALNNRLEIIKTTTKEDKESSLTLLKDLSLGFSYGFSEFRGDIKQDGFLNSENSNISYNFKLTKKVNSLISISSEILFGDLSGRKDKDSYLNSETQSTKAYDPYKLYEELGEGFIADFLEFDLITSINLEEAIGQYYSGYSDNNRFDFCYNIGFGILSFKSIKRNNESKTYIYGYGYKDEEGNFETPKSLFERPTTRVICYGYSIRYLLIPSIKCSFSFLGRLADTDFLDSSLMNQQNDKFRNISLGVEYLF